MGKKRTRAAWAIASLMMLTTAGRIEAVSFFTPNDTLNHNPTNPEIDTWLVKCKAKTTICADVADVGSFNDNTFHVSVVCLLPVTRKGLADLKYAIAPGQDPSADACVTNCQEALVSFQCEAGVPCDDPYNSQIECVSKAFAPGFPIQTQDED